MKPVLRSCFVSIFCLFAAVKGFAALEAPSWVTVAAAQPTPKLAGNPPAVVLLDETTMEISPRGVATCVHRLAIRILDTPGTRYAEASVSYIDKSDKVRSADGWIIRGGHPVKSKQMRDWTDISLTNDSSVYGETREKFVSFSAETASGDVFAAETVMDDPMLVSQLRYCWGWDLPVVSETYRVRVPPNFNIAPFLHAGDKAPRAVTSEEGRCTTWELRDQPYRPPEPYAIALARCSPDLLVAIEAPAGADSFAPKAFHHWGEVTDWAQALSAGQCDTCTALADTSRQLTRESTDSLAKIRALGTYVQKLRYVALDTDLGKGAGYRPRKASQVFGQGFGDCKDKANLLQAMLKEVGISSYTVLALASEDGEVWPEFPSPSQFNHAFLAIAVDPAVKLPAVIAGPNGERLLIFDPTDPFTQVGDIPARLQGQKVHVMIKGSDALVVLPSIQPSEGHAVERKASLKIAADGSVAGHVAVTNLGQPGANLRGRFFHTSSPKELDELFAGFLSEGLRGSQLLQKHRDDADANGRSGVTFDFTSKRFLQTLPNAMTLARLDILNRDAIPAFAAKDRTLPVRLRPLLQTDEIVLELPPGFGVEELPKAASFESAYGSYRRAFELRGNTVVFTRRVELKDQIVPVADYAALRRFFSDVGKTDRAAVLLKTAAPAAEPKT